jgi:molecular chaperone DnaK
VLRDSNGNVKLDCPAQSKQFAPEEISAQVLRKLVDDASKYWEKPLPSCITYPHTSTTQRKPPKMLVRLRDEVMRSINEPTAASLAYGLIKEQRNHSGI